MSDRQIQADEMAQLQAYIAENSREAQPELEELDAPPDSSRSGMQAEEDGGDNASTHDLVDAEHARLQDYERRVPSRDADPRRYQPQFRLSSTCAFCGCAQT